MANVKISNLTAATTPVAGTEVLPIVQSGATVKVSIANLTAGRAVSVLSLTSTNDSTISGLTVGKGAGAVATNTAVGSGVLASGSQTGARNSAGGYIALAANTSGSDNTAYGGYSLTANTTGGSNSAFGVGALQSNTTGGSNFAAGYGALLNNTTASNNTAVGYQAGYSNTTANGSTFVGYQAGYSSNYTSGNTYNTFVGFQAGYSVTTGNRNVIIGNYSGNAGGLDIRTSSNNIVLSDGDGNPRLYRPSSGGWVFAGQTDGYDSIKCLVSGTNPYGIQVDFTAADPNNATSYVFGAYDSFASVWMYRIYSNGTVAARSDARWKKNIETTRNGYAEDLSRLRVVKYNWYNHEDGAPKELGFIAQEVEQVFPNLVQTDPVMKKREVTDELGNITEEEYQDGDSKSIKTSVFIPMLVKAIQELKAEVDSLKAQINGASA